ncbi:hypothetical protein K493DRAFT_361093 [Basidiobolus meristosporus CBS 931.73]|uniref:Uncharacterized protein n=1 Tax=Basidiobolus meristosporus CBS 931.73 TaxID=1314790 RepID=A0A1Y1XCA0_9FUNG|nr:hypothetical protein K493DRAFT_361093 [Basidiobolus meristosporus CBS 931.73]|eukprot:ORX83411.1 hypothetical protein K493DRAFT_361093 [Basidiobolus meristosporus CBS 931.73]
MPERHRYQMMEQPEDTSMEENPTPMEMQSYKDTPMTMDMDMDMDMDMNMAMFGMQPKRALMDEMRGYSAQESGALSKSNQFDQAQHLDQTLYQPAQPVQSQVIIPQYFPHRCGRPYKNQSGHFMDEMRGYSAQESGALSKSNQFDQAQHLDQTLYQPAQPSALAAPMHNLATGVSAVAKTTYQTSACRSPKYMESEQLPMMMMTMPERHHYQMMEQPEDTSMEEDPTPMEMQSYKDTPMTMDMNMAMFGMQPKRALMDEMRGYSAQESGALSKSNQFDQAQHLDQTLYQPAQPVQSQVIIPQSDTMAGTDISLGAELA